MRLVGLLALLALTPTVAASQQLRGRVIDAETREPLANAVVMAGAVAVRTASDGSFRLTPSTDTAPLIVSRIGYRPDTTRVRNGMDLDRMSLALTPAPTTLLPLRVQADRAFSAASSRSVRELDLQLRPRESSQELLRLAPGLVIAQHAGGGKAEQLFLRGFDADHGTDVALSVDGTPVNLVSHAHGQGYADLHFVIPETVQSLDVRKGPYDARDGDFATAGSVSLQLHDRIAERMIAVRQGNHGSRRAVVLQPFGTDPSAAGGYLALAGQGTRGPFEAAQDHRRFNGLLRWSSPFTSSTEIVASASGYHARWDASGQIPERAVAAGMLSRFGAIDPTEGGSTHRTDASLALRARDDRWQVRMWGARYGLQLFSNFTFFRADSVNGDGIEQRDARTILGADARVSHRGVTVGTGVRHDDAMVALHRQRERTRVGTTVDADVSQTHAFIWSSVERRLAPRLRAQFGARADYLQQGTADQRMPACQHVSMPLVRCPSPDSRRRSTLFSPRGGLAFDVAPSVTLFANAGRGFHSNDARLVAAGEAGRILPSAVGTELGARGNWDRMALGVALWRLDLSSELVYVGDEGTTESSGRTRRVGIEADARARIAPWLWADADVSLSRGRFVDEPVEESRIPLAPRVTASAGLTARNGDHASAALRWRAVGGRPADERGEIIARGHSLLELSATRRVGAFQLTVAVDNLLDAEWNEAQFATTSRLRGEPREVTELHFTPGSPRSVSVGVAYSRRSE